jgi:nucleotide-binding universal stress UspA family protein
LKYALTLAAQLGAKVTPMHALEQLPYGAEWLTPLQLSDFAPTTRHLETALRKFAGGAAIGNPIVRIGRSAEEIVATAKETGSDLIILSTHGYTGLKHVLLGSVAEYVVRHAPCPVLTVRADECCEEPIDS